MKATPKSITNADGHVTDNMRVNKSLPILLQDLNIALDFLLTENLGFEVIIGSPL